MPVADFVKPNPLDSDVIMDATARLLAPRRPVSAGTAQAARQKKTSGQSGKKSPRNGGGQPKAEPRNGRNQPKAAQKDAGRQHSQGGQPNPPGQAAAQPAAAPAKKKKRRRNDRPRPLERSLYAHQKDSTEQESLMRPYYISHDD